MSDFAQLSRRERQIMEIVFARNEATATDVIMAMDDPPSRAAIRAFLRILEDKGHLRHVKRAREFVYHPTQQRERTGQSALQTLLNTFFDGSLEKAVASHLSDPKAAISSQERKRLSALVRQSRIKKGQS